MVRFNNDGQWHRALANHTGTGTRCCQMLPNVTYVTYVTSGNRFILGVLVTSNVTKHKWRQC